MAGSLDKNQVKICILTSAHPPFDARIFHKEAKTLAKAGYNVVLIAQHTRAETIDDIRIVPLPKPKNRFERMTKVVWKLFRLALREKANVYHFHDPELIPVGLILKFLGKNVIYDMHELVFLSIEDKSWLASKFLKKLSQFSYLLLEKISVRILDRLILAEDGYEHYCKQTHKKFGKYTIVRNYPIVSLIKGAPAYAHIDKRKPVVIYAGRLAKIRGIKEVIRAMEFISDRAELWLLGKWESEEFKKECEDLKGWKYTKYLGEVALSKVYEYMKVADIGISALYPIKNYKTSLPTKAFEYMACSLPVVMSNFPYWQETFGQCALFTNPNDPKDVADRILYLLDNPDKAKELGDKGKQLTQEKYNWEVEQKKLLDIYEKVLNK